MPYMDVLTTAESQDPIHGFCSFLTATRSRVLVSMLLLDRPSYTREILEVAAVPQSTWSDCLLVFSRLGFIRKESMKVQVEGRLKLFAVFALTDRGKKIAGHLSAIMKLVQEASQDAVSANVGIRDDDEVSSRFVESDSKDLDLDILKCIEEGLESYGEQTKNAVRIDVALGSGVSWSNVPRNIEVFKTCLRERFGPKGAASIEAAIVKAIRNRYHDLPLKPEESSSDLSSCIRLLRNSYTTAKVE